MDQNQYEYQIANKQINQSDKLSYVCYDIRGPVLQQAVRLEQEGHRILRLNIGNPSAFGFNAPDEILRDVVHNLSKAQGYCDSRGLYTARKAVMQECQRLGIPNVGIDDIYLGNGVSELITMAIQALINNGDEVLIPAPDYPLWTAAVRLSGGNPVHYVCDEQADWYPCIEDIASKITSKTRAIVIINPNNPTGAVYNRQLLLELLELARQQGLVVLADEIYSKILYDETEHIAVGSLAEDLLVVSFNGLSKAYRLAGFRSGWMVISGAKLAAKSYIEGLEILSNMRLCANVPAQFAVQTALGGRQSINELILPGGRLREQRDSAYELIEQIPGVSCVKPRAAIYLFPRLDPRIYQIDNDEDLVLNLLRREKVLLVQGSAFNIRDNNHLRLVFLPRQDELRVALEGLERVLASVKSIKK
ncbi:MAG: pyridoxal phosphate-dependent aminotransferase [Gammaproteobacteria bacterium]|nr:pyridoxal phosphate-dependent aminotransferase [Gammaproteobacteria bacterium]